jgi:hypothetical protein
VLVVGGFLVWIWKAIDFWSNLDFLAGRDWLRLMDTLLQVLAWPPLPPVLIVFGFLWLAVTQRREGDPPLRAHAAHDVRSAAATTALATQGARPLPSASVSPLRITLVTGDGPAAVLLRVEAPTTVDGCTAHLIDFQRIEGDDSPLPPAVPLGPHDHARDGTVTAIRPATWEFLQVEDPHPETPGGPLVRRRFFVVTLLATNPGIGARLLEYPLGPGSYIARVEVRSDNAAIEPARLDARVRYTGGGGLSAEPLSEEAASLRPADGR